MHRVFDIIIRLFDSVGIQNKVVKMAGMLCRPCRMVGTQLEAAYERWITGEGIIYRARQRLRVQFPDCGAGILSILLEVH